MYQNYKGANLSSFPTYQSGFQPNNPIFLFIGTITDFVSDEAIEEIFKICGELNSWLRPKDINGISKNFGFCEFSDLESIFKVLKYLNHLELPSPKLGVQTKKLTIKIDNQHKKTIEEYSKTRISADDESDIENKIRGEIQKVIQKNILEIRALQEKDLADLVGKEVSELRMLADSNTQSHSDQNGADNSDEDEDQILKKHEKETKELYEAYYERIKHWELREKDKLRTYEKDKANDVMDFEKREERKATNAELMKTWDDDLEMEKGSHEYYKDRSEWWQRRQPVLKRELDQDERDRLQEKMEIEAKNKRIDLSSRPDETGSISDTNTNEEAFHTDASKSNVPTPQPSTKLTLNLSTHRKRVPVSTTPAIADQHDSDDESSSKTQRKLVPLEYSDSEEESEARRKKKIKTLVDSIPADKEPLFKWPIRWDQVDSSIYSKLKNFTDKKIQEYLGVPEPQLVKFIMDGVAAQKSPYDLVSSLDGALDQDSELFVLKLWRMLIFESEAKYLHIR